ncbi:MAG TPA: transcription antitermination factor NusB [Mycobacteriales bacterium]|nr:transcription antitermination factor NusB [Mycobacteriales bacterium]
MTARSKARKRALDILFESDVRGTDSAETLADWMRRSDPPVPDYAREIVEGVNANRPQLDDAIRASARDWSLERMPPVDRTILRMATYELLCRDDVPVAVVIDEAVELAKSLSTDDSPAFVNGVLARVKEQRSAAAQAARDAAGED